MSYATSYPPKRAGLPGLREKMASILSRASTLVSPDGGGGGQERRAAANLPRGASLTTPLPAMTDAARKSLSPTINAADMEEPLNPKESEREVVEYVKKVFADSKMLTRRHALTWEQCRNHYRGEQWLSIKDWALIDSRNAADIERCFTINLAAPIIEKFVALGTQNRPDAYPVPLSSAPIHKEAASEARFVMGHCARLANDPLSQVRQVRQAAILGGGYRYIRWNPTAPALLPRYGPDGSLVGVRKAPVGEAVEEIIPQDWIFWDASAGNEEEATFAIIARAKPKPWLIMNFGDTAAFCVPDAFSTGDNVTPTSSPTADGSTGSVPRKPDACVVKEYWEKPNRKYPQGRYIVEAGGVLLWSGVWPFDKTDDWPFVGIHFRSIEGSCYAQGLMQQITELSVTVNKEWSRIIARLDKDKRHILIERLSEVGPTAYDEQADLAKLYYTPGSHPPAVQSMPPINEQHFQLLDRAYAHMKDIAGIADILNGKAPDGVTAGIALDLLQQQAISVIKPFITSVESCERRKSEWRIALYSQFATEERMMGLDDRGNSQSGGQGEDGSHRPMALKALTAGGMVQVVVTPGSAVPRSPAGQQQEILDLRDKGLMGPFPDLPSAMSARATIELLEIASGDRVIEAIDAQIEMMLQQMQQDQKSQQEMMQSAATPKVSESIAFKDLPAAAKDALLQEVGLPPGAQAESQQAAAVAAQGAASQNGPQNAPQDDAGRQNAEAGKMLLQAHLDAAQREHEAAIARANAEHSATVQIGKSLVERSLPPAPQSAPPPKR